MQKPGDRTNIPQHPSPALKRAAAMLLAAVVAGCGPDSHLFPRIEPGLKVKPGLWKTVTAARIAPDHPYLRSMPTPDEICVGPDGRGSLRYLEDNGSECKLFDLRRTKDGWAAQSICDRPGLDRVIIYGWVRGDLQSHYTIVGRIGSKKDAFVTDITGEWAGPCPPGMPVGRPPTQDTLYR